MMCDGTSRTWPRDHSRKNGRESEGIFYAGSFTVEAALVMSVVLMVIFLFLQMTLFLTDTVRMDALLTEDSSYTQEEEEARENWFRNQAKGFFFLDADEIRRSADEDEVTESYEQANIALGFGRQEEIQKSVTREVRDPVGFLYLVMLTKNQEE